MLVLVVFVADSVSNLGDVFLGLAPLVAITSLLAVGQGIYSLSKAQKTVRASVATFATIAALALTGTKIWFRHGDEGGRFHAHTFWSGAHSH